MPAQCTGAVIKANWAGGIFCADGAVLLEYCVQFSLPHHKKMRYYWRNGEKKLCVFRYKGIQGDFYNIMNPAQKRILPLYSKIWDYLMKRLNNQKKHISSGIHNKIINSYWGMDAVVPAFKK